MSELAREFDCTPSAISYIVRKAEAMERQPTADDTTQRTSAGPQPETPVPAVKIQAPTPPPPAVRVKEPRMHKEPPASAEGRSLRAESVAAPPPPPPPAVPAADPPRPDGADELETRVSDTARSCMEVYRTWRQAQTEANDQALRDAIHEMRKALARIEIEMSAGRREERTMRPIPIPAHRASRRVR